MVGLVAAGGWLGYKAYTGRDAEWEQLVAEQKAEIDKLQKQNEELQTRNRLLKVDQRIGRLDVINQRQENGRTVTTVDFVELGQDGQPLHSPRRFDLDGQEVWIDAWVVKFKDEYVETGHPLQGKSIYWLKGIFGEHETPASAHPLDEPGHPPFPYRGDKEPSPFEERIWNEFWGIASDPKKLEAIGARAAGGEGPHQRVKRGERWRIELRSSGGLSFVPDGTVPDIQPDAV
jgi:hypothetical protein